MVNEQKLLLRLDPRIRCIMALTMSPVAFLLNSPLSSAIFTAGIAILMFLSGIYKRTIFILFFYGIFMIFEYVA